MIYYTYDEKKHYQDSIAWHMSDKYFVAEHGKEKAKAIATAYANQYNYDQLYHTFLLAITHELISRTKYSGYWSYETNEKKGFLMTNKILDMFKVLGIKKYSGKIAFDKHKIVAYYYNKYDKKQKAIFYPISKENYFAYQRKELK